MNTNKLKLIVRALSPQIVSSLYYFIKYRAQISHKAEVDITSNFSMGRSCVISSFTKIKARDGELTIGNRGGIATGCFVSAGAAGIKIGENFICGPNVNIIGSNYSHSQTNIHLEDLGHTSKGIKIGNNVWLGAGVSILDGSVLGDNTIVAANSLVNRRYPPNVIIQGSPGKILLKRS